MALHRCIELGFSSNTNPPGVGGAGASTCTNWMRVQRPDGTSGAWHRLGRSTMVTRLRLAKKGYRFWVLLIPREHRLPETGRKNDADAEFSALPAM